MRSNDELCPGMNDTSMKTETEKVKTEKNKNISNPTIVN